jgi:hypothetical protein
VSNIQKSIFSIRPYSTKAFIKYLIKFSWLILLVYSVWQMFFKQWLSITIGIYFLIAVLVYLRSLVLQQLVSIPFTTSLRAFTPIANIRSITLSRFNRIKEFLGIQLGELSRALVWPSTILGIFIYRHRHEYRYSSEDVITRTAYVTLNPLDPALTYSSLFFLALVLLINKFVRLPLNIQNGIATLFALHVITMLLGYCLFPTSLTEKLRGCQRNPYIQFILIAISLYSILIVSISGLNSGLSDITFDGLAQTVILMLDLSVTKLLDIQNNNLRFSDYLTIISTLLLGAAGLTSVFSWKNFQRTSNDYHNIATSFFILRKYQDALNWLNKVKPLEAATHNLFALTYLGLNQIEKSEESILRYLISQKKEFSNLIIRQELVRNYGFRFLPASIRRKFIKRYLEAQPNEIELFITFGLISVFGRDENVNYEKIALEFISIFLTTGEDKKHPLVFSTMLRLARHFDKAQKITGNIPESANASLETLRLLTILLNDIMDPAKISQNQDEKVLDDWANKYSNKIIKLIEEIIKGSNSLEKEAVYSYMMMLDMLVMTGQKNNQIMELISIRNQLGHYVQNAGLYEALLNQYRQKIPLVKIFGQSRYI